MDSVTTHWIALKGISSSEIFLQRAFECSPRIVHEQGSCFGFIEVSRVTRPPSVHDLEIRFPNCHFAQAPTLPWARLRLDFPQALPQEIPITARHAIVDPLVSTPLTAPRREQDEILQGLGVQRLWDLTSSHRRSWVTRFGPEMQVLFRRFFDRSPDVFPEHRETDHLWASVRAEPEDATVSVDQLMVRLDVALGNLLESCGRRGEGIQQLQLKLQADGPSQDRILIFNFPVPQGDIEALKKCLQIKFHTEFQRFPLQDPIGDIEVYVLKTQSLAEPESDQEQRLKQAYQRSLGCHAQEDAVFWGQVWARPDDLYAVKKNIWSRKEQRVHGTEESHITAQRYPFRPLTWFISPIALYPQSEKITLGEERVLSGIIVKNNEHYRILSRSGVERWDFQIWDVETQSGLSPPHVQKDFYWLKVQACRPFAGVEQWWVSFCFREKKWHLEGCA